MGGAVVVRWHGRRCVWPGPRPVRAACRRGVCCRAGRASRCTVRRRGGRHRGVVGPVVRGGRASGCGRTSPSALPGGVAACPRLCRVRCVLRGRGRPGAPRGGRPATRRCPSSAVVRGGVRPVAAANAPGCPGCGGRPRRRCGPAVAAAGACRVGGQEAVGLVDRRPCGWPSSAQQPARRGSRSAARVERWCGGRPPGGDAPGAGGVERGPRLVGRGARVASPTAVASSRGRGRLPG